MDKNDFWEEICFFCVVDVLWFMRIDDVAEVIVYNLYEIFVV